MTTSTSHDRAPMRVLLVEDDRVHQTLIARRLENWGHHVVTVNDGEQAVRACRELLFDVVIMDADMPVMNGADATREIRQCERNTGRHVPILALTACALDGDREQLLAAGMDAYLAKPMRSADLLKVLEQVADRKIVMQTAHSAPTGAIIPTASTLDRSIIREQIGDDTEFLGELVLGYRDQRRALLDRIQSAVRGGDGAEMSAAAHTLKGSLLTFGAGPAAGVARQIESAGKASDFERAPQLVRTLLAEIDRLDVALDALLARGLAD